MPVTEESRHRLHQKLDETIGPEDATTLMEHLPPTGWADLPTRPEMNRRFDMVDQRFEKVDQRFEMVDQRFEMVDQRFEMVDQRFDEIDRRFDAFEKRFDAFEKRFDRLDDRFEAFDKKLTDQFWRFVVLIGMIASLLMAAAKYL